MDYSMNFGETFVSLSKYMLEKDNIDLVMEVLLSGGIICYPTDTVWGIGCDATNVAAVEKVSRLKNRPNGKGFVLLVDSVQQLTHYVEDLHPRVETLLHYHTRPLTIIYKKAKNLPKEVCAPDGSVAIRLTKEPLAKSIIQALGAPLLSTSANISGALYPRIFGEISSEILQGVDYVSKERRWDKTINQPSTICVVDDNGNLEFIRE